MENLEELIKIKKEAEENIKKIKMENKKKKHKNTRQSNIPVRVSHEFSNELEDIYDKRKGDLSRPKITKLMVKHKVWPKLKTDLLNYLIPDKNKRGQLSVAVLLVIIASFFVAIMLFTSGLVVIKIDQALDQDIALGQVNLQDINNDTFGQYADMWVNNADWWGLATIFGLIFGLWISAYIVRNRFPKLGIILDIFFIFIAFIVSLYISSSYQTILDALSSAGEPFLETITPKTSFFILNLPIFIPIIGVVIMVLFHSSIPVKNDERFQTGGLLQGVQ